MFYIPWYNTEPVFDMDELVEGSHDNSILIYLALRWPKLLTYMPAWPYSNERSFHHIKIIQSLTNSKYKMKLFFICLQP